MGKNGMVEYSRMSGNPPVQHVLSLDLKALADVAFTTKAGSLLQGEKIQAENAVFLRFNRKHLWCTLK